MSATHRTPKRQHLDDEGFARRTRRAARASHQPRRQGTRAAVILAAIQEG